jgi:hypothetical protein
VRWSRKNLFEASTCDMRVREENSRLCTILEISLRIRLAAARGMASWAASAESVSRSMVRAVAPMVGYTAHPIPTDDCFLFPPCGVSVKAWRRSWRAGCRVGHRGERPLRDHGYRTKEGPSR